MLELAKTLVRYSTDLRFSILCLLNLLLHLAARIDTRVHLRKQQPQHPFSVFPLKVVQIDFVTEGFLRFLIIFLVSHSSWLLQLFLLTYLLPDLFFDLFECFQEKLLDFAALVQNHLGQRSNISQLFILNSEIFTRIDDVFALLFDNSLVLVSDQFFFFLEITHDLVQALGQNLNFVLVRCVFLSYHALANCVLFLSAQVDV